MQKNFLKAASKNKAGKTLFYIFEIVSVCVGFIMFIMAIVNATSAGSFGLFISGVVNAVVYTLIVFGIGKIIDLLSSINEAGIADENENVK